MLRARLELVLASRRENPHFGDKKGVFTTARLASIAHRADPFTLFGAKRQR
jgi:hypothetical protein